MGQTCVIALIELINDSWAMARKPRLPALDGVIMVPLLLPAFIAFISRVYDVHDEDLRGSARTRVLSEARRTIGCLVRQFGPATLQEVAVSFYWAASTFSRQISQIDAGVRSRKGGMPTLHQYSKALTQACPHFDLILNSVSDILGEDQCLI